MKWAKYSLIISALGIIAALYIEWSIYLDYQAATGKSRAVFLGDLHYIYHKAAVFIGGIISLVLAIIANRKKEALRNVIIAMLLATITILIPFLFLWRIFI